MNFTTVQMPNVSYFGNEQIRYLWN